jgi:hypothetical protein
MCIGDIHCNPSQLETATGDRDAFPISTLEQPVIPVEIESLSSFRAAVKTVGERFAPRWPYVSLDRQRPAGDLACEGLRVSRLAAASIREWINCLDSLRRAGLAYAGIKDIDVDGQSATLKDAVED